MDEYTDRLDFGLQEDDLLQAVYRGEADAPIDAYHRDPREPRGEHADTSVDSAKSDFMASVSHELRTPLNAMLGFCELIQSQVHGPIGNKHYEAYINDIHASGRDLLRLVENVLELTRIEVGRLPVRSVPFGLRRWMTSCARSLRVDTRPAGIRLIAEVEDGAADDVLGDPVRLFQVTQNFVRNALLHAQCSTITIRANQFEAARGTETYPFLRIEVVDDGIGIQRKDQNDMFDSFGQRNSAYRALASGGIGLGLAMSKGLVELMDGTVGMSSKPGRGSRFWFTVPFGGGSTG
ncbi:MAG: ATP-binding protein [Nitratireductor sp.]